MDHLPLFVATRDRPCVVVGGGPVAARKIAMLLRAQARVTVVAPAPDEAVARLAEQGRVTLERRPFTDPDVAGAVLVVAATDDDAVNLRVADAARAAGVLVNVVDRPDACSAIMPSIVDRSPVVIAIGTGGAAPVLARLLRAKLESMIPAAYGRLAALLGSLRARVREAIPSFAARRRFWEDVLEGPAAELLFAGREDEARAVIERLLASPGARAEPRGEVCLVGTGPGDPDLLTFRALRLMQSADVVVHDRLVSNAILDLCRRDAERVFVGKASDRHSVTQETINALLARLASEGKRVVRLKGGDPFVFGRGGEEIETLAAAGVDFQVVPGVTAALGCAAFAGIPLTHRGVAHSCVFVTAHLEDGRLELNWTTLVQPRQTVVVYMGVAALPALGEALVANGLAPDVPAAIVERGTLPGQRVLVTTVADMAGAAAARRIVPPSLVIIGEVVRLRERLSWFERTGPANGPPG